MSDTPMTTEGGSDAASNDNSNDFDLSSVPGLGETPASQSQDSEGKRDSEGKTEKAKEAARKMRLKVDGEELELDESEVITRAQKSSAAEKRFAEAAELRKALALEVNGWKKNPRAALERLGVNPVDFARDLLMSDAGTKEQFAKDPAGVLKALGVDPRQWAARHYAEAVEEELMTPEEKASRDEKRELEELREYRRQRDERDQTDSAQKIEARNEEIRGAAAGQVQTDVIEAIKASGVEPTPQLVFNIARRLSAYLDHLPDDAEIPPDLARRALDEYRDEAFEAFGQFSRNLPDDAFHKKLPKHVAERLRKRDMDEVRGRSPGTQMSGDAPKPKPKKALDLETLFEGRTL